MNHKFIFKFLIILISLVPWLAFGQNKINEQALVRIGVSQINITPEEPTLLAGYSDRNTPFTGVHDSLYASALYFSDEKNKTLFITADLVGFSFAFVDETRKLIFARTGIPTENIMIAAVHNHSGPEMKTYENYNYPEFLKEKLIRLSADAMKNPVPFKMGIGKGSCNLNINRRAEFADGSIWLGKNPEGACDHELDAVKFVDMNNKTIAVLINWPCHGTVEGSDNYQISGDWPGRTASYIRKQEGKNVVVAVTAGASANINPIYCPGDKWYQDLDAVGYHVGKEACNAIKSIEFYPIKTLQTTNAVMTFPGKKGGIDHLPHASYESAPDREIRLSTIKIGNLVLSGVSGELMTEIGMDIKKQSPYSETMIITHCNGSSGYICTDKAFTEGGYEVQVSHFMPGIEKPLTNKFLQLIRSF